MRKYIALIKAELLYAVQEKAETFVWLLLETMPALVMGFLLLANKNQIANLNVSALVTYFVIVLIISRLTSLYFDEDFQDEIRDGTFSRFLLKPIRFPFSFIPMNIGNKLFNTAFILFPVVIITSIVFRNQLMFPNLPRLLLFCISLVIAYGLQYTMAVVVASSAFFWEQSRAVLHAKWMLDNFAGGYMLPISFYPIAFRTIINYLPFQYIYFIPASIFIGGENMTWIIRRLLLGLLWLIVLLFVSHCLWKRGIKKYSSVGG